MSRKTIYLNHAATSPIPKETAEAMKSALDALVLDGPDFREWIRASTACRRNVAKLMGTKSRCIAFLLNTSQALSTIAYGMDWEVGDEVLLPAIEYPANVYPWMSLGRKGVKAVTVDPEPDGTLPLERIAGAITDRTRLLAISHVQYSNGFRIDMKALTSMCHERGILVAADVIQSLGALPVNVEAWDVDFAAAGSQKWLLSAPGVGILYVKESLLESFLPTMVGAMSVVDPLAFDSINYQLHGDAMRFESGTANYIGLIGLEASTRMLLDHGIETVTAKVLDINAFSREQLATAGFEVVSPAGRENSSGICVFTKERVSSRELVDLLAENHIIAAVRTGRVRLSPHFYNTREEIQHCIHLMRNKTAHKN